jgi:hypothetical protein
MVKRSASNVPGSGGGRDPDEEAARGKNAYSVSDIDDMEKQALDKANKAISAIENAIAVWEASQDKPEDLKPRMIRLKYFYDALSNWEKKLLKSMGRQDQVGERVERLKEFTEICLTYS